MRPLRHLCRWIAERCCLIGRSELVGQVSAGHPIPEELCTGTLILVRDGGLDKWACFRCPGGCGEKIQLSLSQTRRPRWAARFDWLLRPTVHPSVRQLNACRCHFWVKRGRVFWCADSGRRRDQVPKRTSGACGRR